MKIELRPIGYVHSELKDPSDCPIQPSFSEHVGEIEVLDEYVEGLRDLDGFSHITLVFYFDRVKSFDLLTYPYLDDKKRGVFATRTPRRPNPVGLSVLQILNVAGNRIKVKGIDILDNTPVLDIKPFVPGFVESYDQVKISWLSDKIRIAAYSRKTQSRE